MCDCEKWKAVPGFGGRYEISDRGRIRRVLSPQFNNGYDGIILSFQKKYKSVRIHSLVAEAFIGPRPDGEVVNHKDGNKLNNNMENLEYMSQGDNVRHAITIGSMAFQPEAKLAPVEVLIIRSCAGHRRLNRKVLAKMYGVSQITIKDIQRGDTWRDLRVPSINSIPVALQTEPPEEQYQ